MIGGVEQYTAIWKIWPEKSFRIVFTTVRIVRLFKFMLLLFNSASLARTEKKSVFFCVYGTTTNPMMPHWTSLNRFLFFQTRLHILQFSFLFLFIWKADFLAISHSLYAKRREEMLRVVWRQWGRRAEAMWSIRWHRVWTRGWTRARRRRWPAFSTSIQTSTTRSATNAIRCRIRRRRNVAQKSARLRIQPLLDGPTAVSQPPIMIFPSHDGSWVKKRRVFYSANLRFSKGFFYDSYGSFLPLNDGTSFDPDFSHQLTSRPNMMGPRAWCTTVGCADHLQCSHARMPRPCMLIHARNVYTHEKCLT